MIYAYYQGDNIDYWLSRSGLEFHRDLDYAVWLSRPIAQRLALHEELAVSNRTSGQVRALIKNSALCLIFVPELINDTWFDQFDEPNVIFFIAGLLNVPQADTVLLDQDQWYRGQLLALAQQPNFEQDYESIRGEAWPSADELIAMPIPLRHIVDELCERFMTSHRAPVVVLPEIETTVIQDRWQQILSHPLFKEFYNNIRDAKWPDLGQLQDQTQVPEHVRQEILLTFQEPVEQDPNQRLDAVCNVVQARANASRLEHAQTLLHGYFFWSTTDLYRRHPKLIDHIEKNLDQRRGFDVLLGRKKHHRDIIYQGVDHDINTVTYFDSADLDDVAHTDRFIWPESVLPRPQGKVKDTTEIVTVDGVITSVSQIIPTDIYNRTAYTLVCESQCDNGFSFFTEKVIKPMIARRIFVVFSGQYYLKNLRKLGFRTFDGIFDESYDTILRMEDRGQAVIDLVRYLCERDPVDLYQQAQEILDHNYDLVMRTDWQQVMCDAIKKRIDNRFGDK